MGSFKSRMGMSSGIIPHSMSSLCYSYSCAYCTFKTLPVETYTEMQGRFLYLYYFTSNPGCVWRTANLQLQHLTRLGALDRVDDRELRRPPAADRALLPARRASDRYGISLVSV